MKRNYRKLLRAGNRAQLEKLKENSHKDGFDNIDIDYAINRIQTELNELKYARRFYKNNDVRREAADVANFAHMIILSVDNEKSHK